MYDATFRIIIFGDFIVERKALVDGFLTELFESDQTMTIGFDYFVKSLSIDGLKVKLQIMDFGGEERFRFLYPTYARQARGGLFLYDVTNYSTIKHIDDWLSLIGKEIRAEDMFPILAVGIVPEEECERQVSREEGIKIAKSRNLNGFIECNPKTGENVEKAFEALTRLMLDDTGYQRRKREKVKDEAKVEADLITYTRNLEKEVRNLETDNSLLEAEISVQSKLIKQLRLDKQLRLKRDLNDLQDGIDKYKKMGINLVDEEEREKKKG